MTGFLAQSGGSMLPERPVAKAGFLLPFALIGAGLAWLALEARRREQNAERRRHLAQDAAEREAALAASAATAYPLAEVESTSLVPAPFETEKQDQRSLPL
jgi:hypothetical protein